MLFPIWSEYKILSKKSIFILAILHWNKEEHVHGLISTRLENQTLWGFKTKVFKRELEWVVNWFYVFFCPLSDIRGEGDTESTILKLFYKGFPSTLGGPSSLSSQHLQQSQLLIRFFGEALIKQRLRGWKAILKVSNSKV